MAGEKIHRCTGVFVCIFDDPVQLFLDQGWSQKAAIFIIHLQSVQNSFPEYSNVLKKKICLHLYVLHIVHNIKFANGWKGSKYFDL